MSKFNFTWWEQQLENASAKQKASLRYRNFVTIVYPDSAPEDWKQRLDEYCTPYFISPLHDRDKCVQGDQPKKAHYHVMLMFDNVKAFHQIKSIFDDIGGVGGEIVQSLRGQARYLCHLDNPEKARYSTCDVVSGFGASYDDICVLASDIYQITDMMIDVIDAENFLHFDDFARWCRDNNREWHQILQTKRTYYIREYIYSKYKKSMIKG